MIEDPVYTVIVPVYNAAAYLKNCLHSILQQTFHKIEILLIDDGSIDDSPAICDQYAAMDARIRVIHKINGGASEARNIGLSEAKGTYIMFVDADDMIELDACERFLPYTEKNFDILVGDGVSHGGQKYLQHSYPSPIGCDGKIFLKTAFQHSGISMTIWLYLYRRSFLIENRLQFKVGSVHEDDHFVPRAFLAANTTVNTGILFYHYIIRDNSISNRPDLRKNADDLYQICLEMQDVIADIEDDWLKAMLLDSLVMKYLSLFQVGKLYQYGAQYLHKDLIHRNSYTIKTKLKAALYCSCPWLYWHINNVTKMIKHMFR